MPGWYEGVGRNVPSTNNALESVNRYIKDHSTLFFSFLVVITERIVKPWSLARNPSNINYEPFAVLPTITSADETAAWQWLQQRMRVVRKTLNDRVLHFVGAGQAQITKQDVDAYLTRRANEAWDTLEELARDRNGMWIIQINANNWRASQCS